MKRLPAQSGFTLIELVVVIVILGILAATAAPKFIDLTGDARLSVMQGIRGNIESAVSIAHAKALIETETGATGEIQIGTQFYALVNGFPAAGGANTANGTTGNGFGITGMVDLSADDITVSAVTVAPATFQYSTVTTPANCQLSYAAAANSETRPVITFTDTGC